MLMVLMAAIVLKALAMLAEIPQRTAQAQAKLQHRQIRRWRPAPQRQNPPALAHHVNRQHAEQQRKRRLPQKNNRLAPRALAARAEICNALRLLFSVRSPPPIQETTR